MTEREFMIFAANVLELAAAGVREGIDVDTSDGDELAESEIEQIPGANELATEAAETIVAEVKLDYNERLKRAMEILKGEKD